MSIPRSAVNVWSKISGKLIVLLLIACLGLAGYMIFSDLNSTTATDKSIVQSSNPGNASTAHNDLLPVTTTPGVPDTSGVNSPGNSGQNIQSQPDSTPKTSSPQQAAPATPDDANAPASSQPTQPTPTPTPINSKCGVCGGGGGGFRKPAIACPMYCME